KDPPSEELEKEAGALKSDSLESPEENRESEKKESDLPMGEHEPETEEKRPVFLTGDLDELAEKRSESREKRPVFVTGELEEEPSAKSAELESYLKARGRKELVEMLEGISNIAEIHYVRQKEPLGLGDAVYCAKRHVDGEPFLVLLGDDIIDPETPCITGLMEEMRKFGSKSSVIAFQEVAAEFVNRYGIIEPGAKISESLIKIRGLVEKPAKERAPSRMALIGRYALSPEIFDCLGETEKDSRGEVQLTDAINGLLLKGGEVYGKRFSGRRYDVGDKLEYLKTIVEFALRRKEFGPEFREYLKGV
ncbi:MAG: UTP--glucose-1-phosphate uridylyltransferase, partial [Candidatus Micrarchaeota archaeon]|nr:UTP--glucose-1-phosphate uridylyltransferase [Candidatus Micrarchaeota archaeon]